MTLPFLLVDIGNTHTRFALADARRVGRVIELPTARWRRVPFRRGAWAGAVVASVVPAATRRLQRVLPGRPLLVTALADLGLAVDYPNKAQVGADRLANAVGAARLYGAPVIVVDFGTAVTFDIVDRRPAYIGGVIAPGLAAMTEYLYQRTALLPRLQLREPRRVIGKSTVGAMEVGAVIGYRGLVKEILGALRREPGLGRAVVVATGGYGDLIARQTPAIHHVNPLLTLEGLRFIYLRNQ